MDGMGMLAGTFLLTFAVFVVFCILRVFKRSSVMKSWGLYALWILQERKEFTDPLSLKESTQPDWLLLKLSECVCAMQEKSFSLFDYL